MRLARSLYYALVAATLAWAPDSPAADAERGRILYESRCDGCHSTSVHGRDKRIATDFEAVRGWVRRWSAHLGLAWKDDEVNDVSVHLNERYYHFRCPASVCLPVGLRETPGRIALDGPDPLQVP